MRISSFGLNSCPTPDTFPQVHQSSYMHWFDQLSKLRQQRNGQIIAAGKNHAAAYSQFFRHIHPGNTTEICGTILKMLDHNGSNNGQLFDLQCTTRGYQVCMTQCACFSYSREYAACAYNLGLFIGTLEIITGKPFKGEKAGCVAEDQASCVYNLEFL